MLARDEQDEPVDRTFTLDDGAVYQRIPAADLPSGDDWDSVEVEERLAAAPRVRSLVSVVSQNGWSANDRGVIASFTIPGTRTRIALRAGDCSVLLLDFLAWYSREIEPIDGDVLDDWGYAERTIRGSATTLSNHASGTAADHNATRHPLSTKTLAKATLGRIRDRIALYRGALRHGAFYTGRVDEMHVEIDAGPALVREVADDIRAGRLTGGGTPMEDDDMPYRDWPKEDKDALLNDVKWWSVQPETVQRRDDLTGYLETRFAEMRALITSGTADVDEEALATALAGKLSGTSKADIAAALRQVLREGVEPSASS